MYLIQDDHKLTVIFGSWVTLRGSPISRGFVKIRIFTIRNRFNRQFDGHSRAANGSIDNLDTTAMGFDDILYNAQSKAGALILGCKKWIPDFI